ncbi:unnamed protein product [Dimorphilus gyrociliatus]|uniref:CIP2A N-terminal domain-containing protein n=1 Tax=Dimorphilus gyrociliatus TaxID=2664684 RepID=A0A7I8VC86_9ANNE|nr:unnamed protein product [Dimorphilus gyrociliatus]
MNQLIIKLQNSSYNDMDLEDFKQSLKTYDFSLSHLTTHEICRVFSQNATKFELLPELLKFLEKALENRISPQQLNQYDFPALLINFLSSKDSTKYTLKCLNILSKLCYKLDVNLAENLAEKFINEATEIILKSYDNDDCLFTSAVSALVAVSFENENCRRLLRNHSDFDRVCKRFVLSLQNADDYAAVLGFLAIERYCMHSDFGLSVYNKPNINQTIEFLFNLIVFNSSIPARKLAVDLFIQLISYSNIVAEVGNFTFLEQSIKQLIEVLSIKDRAEGVIALLINFLDVDTLSKQVLKVFKSTTLRNKDIAEILVTNDWSLEPISAIVYWTFNEVDSLALQSSSLIIKLLEDLPESEEDLIDKIEFMCKQLNLKLKGLQTGFPKDDLESNWFKNVFYIISKLKNEIIVLKLKENLDLITLRELIVDNIANLNVFEVDKEQAELFLGLCATSSSLLKNLHELVTDKILSKILSQCIYSRNPLIVCLCMELSSTLKKRKFLIKTLGKQPLNNSNLQRTHPSQHQKMPIDLESLREDDADSRINDLIAIYEKRLEELALREEQTRQALESRNSALTETDKLLNRYKIGMAEADAERKQLLSIISKFENENRTKFRVKEEEVAKLNDDIANILKQKQNIENEKASLNKELTEYKTVLKENSSEIKRLKHAITDLKGQIDKKEKLLNESSKENHRLETAISDLRTELGKKEESLKLTTEKKKALEIEVDKSGTMITELRDQLGKYTQMASLINGLTSGKIDASILNTS